MLSLPVSGIRVQLRPPTGGDELAVAEGPRDAIAAALGLIELLAQRQDGEPADWPALPVTDFECLLLHLREMVFGGEISARILCTDCRERVEISFRITDYLARVRTTMPPGVTPSSEPGWFQIEHQKFRAPRVADVVATQGAPRPGVALRALCVAGEGPAANRRVEAALARIAPPVTGEVGGACPGCGAKLSALFDVAAFVVTEFRRLADGVYAHVHLLAREYGWAEAAILALPAARRRHYAGLARESRAAPVY